MLLVQLGPWKMLSMFRATLEVLAVLLQLQMSVANVLVIVVPSFLFFFFLFFETWSHHVTQTGFELVILLPQLLRAGIIGMDHHMP